VPHLEKDGILIVVVVGLVPISEFVFGDRVPFLASDSGSLRKCTNQSESLPHFVAKKKFTPKKNSRVPIIPNLLIQS
jgi:hypothetical protein